MVLIAFVLLLNWWIGWLVSYLFLLLVRFIRMGSSFQENSVTQLPV
jgi:hypothetical protein